MATNDALRSEEMAERYKAHRATGVLERSCPLCDAAPIRSFTHWKIIPNSFPYDMIADMHHMIIPVRHVNEKELKATEWNELHEIKYEHLQDYDIIVEATKRTKSIPSHFHLHLINLKKYTG